MTINLSVNMSHTPEIIEKVCSTTDVRRILTSHRQEVRLDTRIGMTIDISESTSL